MFFPLSLVLLLGMADFDCSCASRPWTHLNWSLHCGPEGGL